MFWNITFDNNVFINISEFIFNVIQSYNRVLDYVADPEFWKWGGAMKKIQTINDCRCLHPFNLEFTTALFTHYKPRIAVAILDL